MSLYDNWDNEEPYFYLENIESSLNRIHITNEVLFDNSDIQIETYMFTNKNIDYIANYVFPFWKSEFLTKNKNTIKETNGYNPFLGWSNSDFAKYMMGLKENTRCFELKTSDITIGFCSLLLIDSFDISNTMSQFSYSIYKDSIFFYNFVLETAFRKLGYGKILFEQVIEYIKKNYSKYTSITLCVDDDNEIAKSFYTKFNFKYLEKNPLISYQSIYKLDLY